ncbi:MAG: serine/threonine protein kinase [Flavobacteriales bacterium]|jgi:serine/threonine protein kinase
MNEASFYDLDEKNRKLMLEIIIGNRGKIISQTSGLCGDIYIFDQGEHVHPRYVCAKVPKIGGKCTPDEAAVRFINELKLQLSFYSHTFVHWAFDFKEVLGAPVALFRYWGSDLKRLIIDDSASDIQKLSIIAYVCSGLEHCYKTGLLSHQDLKPANIFLRNIQGDFKDISDLDVHTFALVADFGLANASVNSGVFDGSRPYMAPEQWNRSSLSNKTDVFALGVILCELITGGYHPVGVKLHDYWPLPVSGNSKKWTGEKHWKKWSLQEDKIDQTVRGELDLDILSLIERMLSTTADERLSVEDTLRELLLLIKTRCKVSYAQAACYIDFFKSQSSNDSLAEQWPYLNSTWEKFDSKFGKGT